MVSEEEISTALWSLKAFKAAGSDGLHVGFFSVFGAPLGIRLKKKLRKCLGIG